MFSPRFVSGHKSFAHYGFGCETHRIVETVLAHGGLGHTAVGQSGTSPARVVLAPRRNSGRKPRPPHRVVHVGVDQIHPAAREVRLMPRTGRGVRIIEEPAPPVAMLAGMGV